MNIPVKVLILLSLVMTILNAQTPVTWKIHDINRPQPKIITPQQSLSIAPPSDAVILYDGSNLSNWQSLDGSAPKWVNKDGFFECVKDSGYIRTRQGFGDVQLHVEWTAPIPAQGKGQGRGNSGVFLMGLYEVQVLDCYNNTTYPDGQAGALYGQSPPLVNASLPPGQWQSYDIIFRRPRFDSLGRLISPAIFTIFHNGVLVQDHVELWGSTYWLHYNVYEAHSDKLPISLQDHGNPVRYRNIWLRELEQEAGALPAYPAVLPFTAEDYHIYSGTFVTDKGKEYIIHPVNNKLMLHTDRRDFELLKYSKERLSAKTTAIDLVYTFNKEGLITEMSYQFEGNKTTTKPKGKML